MSRYWSLLFFLVPILGLAIVVGASSQAGPMQGAWLPESIGPRTQSIDHLFGWIHVIMGVVFALTGMILAVALWRFGTDRSARYQRTNRVLEWLWTLIPAVVLVFLVFYQLPVWNANKVDHPRNRTLDEAGDPLETPMLRAVARQYDWRFVYPGDDELFDTGDDIVSFGEMAVPIDKMLVIELASEDVIHSFCVNELRLKQDIIPGMRPRVWFEIDRPGQWEIICTELCGWGHYRMKARLSAKTSDEFNDWLRQSEMEQFYHSTDVSPRAP